MRKTILFLFLLSSLQSCIAPLNTTFESAETIGKNRVEVKGYNSYSTMFTDVSNGSAFSEFEKAYSIGTIGGVSVGYGITDKYDVKLRGDFIFAPFEYGYSVGLTNKISLVEDYIALNLPISYNEFLLGFSGDLNETIYMTSPQLLFSLPLEDYGDITFATKVDIPLNENSVYTNPLVSYTLGGGFKISDHFTIRTELGYSANSIENKNWKFRSWTIGNGLVYKF